jgi:hypothetical protein
MSGSEAFDPYTPLNVLKQVAAGVWIVDGPEIHFNYLGLKFPCPTRMTLIRLPDGGLWVHSPTSLTDALAGQVRRAGPVRFLIAPNTLHYWWIPDWKARFPDALTFWRHRGTVRAVVERMIAWSSERIIIAHGRWYEQNCAAELRRAFRWVF